MELILRCEQTLEKLYKFSSELLQLGEGDVSDLKLEEFEKEIDFKLANENFTYFKGYSITYRNGVYLINNTYVKNDDKKIFVKKGLTGKIKNIKDINNNFITKSKTEIKSLEKLLDKFDKLDVANLSVDNFQNIQFVFFLNKCSYTFLRLSNKNSLKDINKAYFEKYKKDWYLYKQCSE